MARGRLGILMCLPPESLPRLAIQKHVRDIPKQ